MDSPWSPVSSVYSEADSTCGQGKPATYLILKMTGNGTVDSSSSSKEVLKLLTDQMITQIEENLRIVHQKSHPSDQGNVYGQMLRVAEALHQRDPNQEDVKDLRHFIPLLRKVAYMPREDIEKKMKLKAMWSERPLNWPQDVEHVDPNNPVSGNNRKVPKPKKAALVKMFSHLARVYKEKREQLWKDTFGCSPDEELTPGQMQGEAFQSNGIQDLVDKVPKVYLDSNIHKLIKALVKEFDTMNTVQDPKTWVILNRQKSILEGDLREVVYLHETFGCPHSVENLTQELKLICKNVGLDHEAVLASEEKEEEQQGSVPVTVDLARSPTICKRGPTFNMEMNAEPVIPTTTLGQNTDFPQETPFVPDEMEVGYYEDVATDVFTVPQVEPPDQENRTTRPEPSFEFSKESSKRPKMDDYIADYAEGQAAVIALQEAHPEQAGTGSYSQTQQSLVMQQSQVTPAQPPQFQIQPVVNNNFQDITYVDGEIPHSGLAGIPQMVDAEWQDVQDIIVQDVLALLTEQSQEKTPSMVVNNVMWSSGTTDYLANL